MNKMTAWILLGFLFLGTPPLFAEETAEKKSGLAQVGAIEKRGFVNFATTLGEFGTTLQREKRDHPKAWPLTYVPRTFMNMAIRVSSSVNDIAVLPWYAAAADDDTPLTRHFELPDYVWEKE